MGGTAAAAQSAPPPVEDRPPWDEEPPPPVDDYDRPPLPEEPPAMDEPPAQKAAEKKAAAPAGSGGPDPNWEPFVNLAKDTLPTFLSSLLYQCSATFTDSGMVLNAPPFPFGQLNMPNNLAKLKQCANTFYGRPVELKLESGEAGAPRPAMRSLDDFKNDKFNEIVKFK